MATYVITGCNRGLGLEMAAQLAARGEQVIATARRPEKASDLGELAVEVVPLDITDTSSVDALRERLAGRPVDVLINNAGIGVDAQPLEELEFRELNEFFEVNSIGALRVARALLGNLEKGGKTIVNITSRVGSVGLNGTTIRELRLPRLPGRVGTIVVRYERPRQTAGGARRPSYGYRASKAALNMLTRGLAGELGPKGFICIVLHPGWVRTEMGGAKAPLTPGESVSGMLRVMGDLTPADNGEFLDYRGVRIPW